MKEFPPILNIKNKKQFEKISYNRILCYLRRDLYEHIISKDENNYFEMDKFQNKYNISDEIRDKMSEKIIKELKKLGWNCKLSFGNTALFIYSTKNPPKSCW